MVSNREELHPSSTRNSTSLIDSASERVELAVREREFIEEESNADGANPKYVLMLSQQRITRIPRAQVFIDRPKCTRN